MEVYLTIFLENQILGVTQTDIKDTVTAAVQNIYRLLTILFQIFNKVIS